MTRRRPGPYRAKRGKMVQMQMQTEAETPVRALLEANFDPSALVDPASGRFIAVNEAARVFLGFSEDEFAAMTPSDIHPHEIARLDRFMANVLRQGRWSSDELSCQTREGRLVPALVEARVVDHGDRGAILIVFRDQAERRLAELGGTVRQLTHDLKNSLATAQLMCDRLAGHEDQKVRLSSDNMARALERAVDLCKRTVQTGRAGAPAPERERFLLSDVLEELEATTILPGAGAQALLDDSPAPVPMDADYDQTYRILLNLVRNAFDAGATQVRIHGRGADGLSTIDIADDGPGLPDAVAAQLGTDSAQLSSSGSGLGLRIAADLCRNHGGALTIVGRGAGGTCLRAELPHAG